MNAAFPVRTSARPPRASRWAAAFVVTTALAARPAPAQAGGDVSAAAPAVPAPSDAASLEATWRKSPSDVRTGLRLYAAMCAQGKGAAATSIFRQAHEAGTGGAAAQFLYGRALGGARGLALMRKALEHDLDLPASDAGVVLDAWRALLDADEKERAYEDGAKDADRVARRTGLAVDWARAGWLHERAKDDAGAKAAYERAISIDGGCAPAIHGLTVLLSRTGQGEAAVALARDAVAKFPQSPEAFIRLGMVLGAAGRADEAKRAYSRALEKAQADVPSLVVLGASFTGIEDYASAHKALDRAVSLEPENASALAAAGALALEEGKPLVAVRLLAHAAQASPTDAGIAFLEGVAAERTKDAKAAEAAYARALKLEPGNADFATALSLLLEGQGSIDAALAAIKTAAEASPESAEVQIRLGGLLEAKKRWKPAADAYRAAIRLAPKSPDAHFLLAVVLGDRMSDAKGALAELEQYAALGGKEPSALSWLQALKNPKGK